MPITVGTHENGERFARVDLAAPGITLTVEGTGPNDDVATAVLQVRLHEIAETARAAAHSMSE